MGNYSPGSGIRKRLVILLLFLSSSLFSMELEVLPEKPRVGRVLTLKIITEIESTQDIEVLKDIETPDVFRKINGPAISQYRKIVDRRYKRYHQIKWAFRVDEPGIYDIPEFTVKSGSKTYNLKFPVVKIFLRDEVNNNYPLLVNWRVAKNEIFVGESLPLIVEAHNLEDIKFADDLYSKKPRNGSFTKVQGLGGINQYTVEDKDLYTVSLESWIYTPLEKGVVTIPSVRVKINGLTRYTEELKIDVLPLPETNDTGGVGEFLLSTSLTETQVTPEDFFKYKIKLQGMGNLPYFKIPEISHNGLIIIDKEESESIDHNDKGFLGTREVVYTLQSIEPGVKEITIPSLSWIDWQGNSVYYNGSTSNINVVSSKLVEEEIRPFLSLFTTPQIITSYRISLYKQPLMWLLLLVSPLIIAILAIIKVIKVSSNKKIVIISMVSSVLLFSSVVLSKGLEYQGELVKADNFMEEENFQEAINIYNNLTDKLPYNYGLFMNLSILWDKIGDKTKAVYNVRMAERIYPQNKQIQKLKLYLADSEEFYQKQAKTVTLFNPDYIFFILIVTINLLLYIFIKTRKSGNITTVSIQIFLSLISLSLFIGILYIDNRNNVNSGIINTKGASIKKVPNDMAKDWMELPEGYTVYIRGEWEDKFLIETEYGLQGWITKTELLPLEKR